MFLFDQDGDGKVDSVEFINEFLKLGNEEKNRMRYAQNQSKERIERMKMNIKKKREKHYEKMTAVHVADTWTELDETSAIKKIAKVAFTYDGMKGGLEVRTSLQISFNILTLFLFIFFVLAGLSELRLAVSGGVQGTALACVRDQAVRAGDGCTVKYI